MHVYIVKYCIIHRKIQPQPVQRCWFPTSVKTERYESLTTKTETNQWLMVVSRLLESSTARPSRTTLVKVVPHQNRSSNIVLWLAFLQEIVWLSVRQVMLTDDIEAQDIQIVHVYYIL